MKSLGLTLAVCALAGLLVAAASAYDIYTDMKLRAERGKSANAISKSRLSTYSDVMYLLLKRKKLFKPWLLLPNNNLCYQQSCSRNEDCCRSYNICDKSAKVCIDCWYGFPCKTNGDCCERYPTCEREDGGKRKAIGRCIY